KIDFVSNCGDDRYTRMKDGAGHDLFIERPKVFQAAATARDENRIQRIATARPFIELGNPAGHFFGGTLPLHTTRGKNDLKPAMSSLHDMQNVRDGRPRRRRDQADALDQCWKWPFAFGSEQSLRRELLL